MELRVWRVAGVLGQARANNSNSSLLGLGGGAELASWWQELGTTTR